MENMINKNNRTMKKTIITIVLAIFATICANAQERTRIDFDYKKIFDVDILWLDYNQNQESEDNETYNTTGACVATIEYKDFGEDDSILKLEVVFNNGDKNLKIVGIVDDAMFLYRKEKEKEKTNYLVVNKLGEIQIIISVSQSSTMLVVMNPAMLEII